MGRGLTKMVYPGPVTGTEQSTPDYIADCLVSFCDVYDGDHEINGKCIEGL
jgi:hypothetical protein